MSKREHSGSIFSQKLDRVALTAYFLGAVVPLIALGFVLERFVLPTISDRHVSLGLIGLVLSIGFLSLASFFALFSGVTQSLSLLTRLLFSGRLLSRYGVRTGLVLLPAVLRLAPWALTGLRDR